MIKVCNRVIEYSFYALFLLVPLAFTSKTSELFEMNKMWLVWGLTIVIGAFWLVKMVLQRKFFFQRTPLDIPIGLFLVSQIISTIFSLDVHVSLWGYYSRFNGGLLSTLTYILLYYAFLSNSPTVAKVQKLMTISLISGAIVALWGLPSHFGYDPTCLLFRGTFDVSCWTADFLPKVRIFSTLGQPDWLAAYLAILIPISIAFFINTLKSNSPNSQIKNHESGIMNQALNKMFIRNSLFIILTSLFYIDLLFTRARSGIVGIWLALIFFAGIYYWMRGKPKMSISCEKLKSPLAILFFGFLIITFIIGTPFNQLRIFSLEGIGSYLQKIQAPKTIQKPIQTSESGGTDSADIRLLVWSGAINAWKNNPLFGTGVETFAFAYYKYKPAAQNLTSEWNFLYNKAHNEYLNYLATTGIFGLGTYLGMIGFFLTIVMLNSFQHLNQTGSRNKFGMTEDKTLTLALIASYVSILVTDFFGFSVVMTNVYLFMIPAFIFVLGGMLKPTTNDPLRSEASQRPATNPLSPANLTGIFFILITSCFLLISLFRFWLADIHYALGYNLARAGEYQKAYESLHQAVKLKGDEPVFKNELSINNAILATTLVTQKNQTNQQETISIASSLVQEAVDTSNEVISQYTNNAVFWKTRVRLFYTLSQFDPGYLPRALDAIEKAALIAPNDASIWYNLGVLYGQSNNLEKGISALEKTIVLKPDYSDARYALGLFYHTASMDKDGKTVVNNDLNKKAIDQMQYILENISPENPGALESITNWSK